MELNQATQNIHQAANPNYGEMPTDQLARQLRQIQFENLKNQQKGIGDTKQQIATMQGQKKEAPMMDPAKWGLLADLFAPQGQKTNFAQVGAAITPKDKSGKELYALQQQLGNQEKNLSSTIGKIDVNEPKSYEHLYKIERLRTENNKDLAKFKSDLKSKEAKEPETKPTKGEEEADKAFAKKEYTPWVSGGFSNVQANLEKLKKAQATIDNKETEMGNRWMPQFVRKRYAEDSVAVEQDVANVVFQSLKQILGGQFTEKEGEKLVEQTYDSGLSDVENSKKVKAAYETIQRMAAAKQEAVDYFQKNGTISGFKGGNYSSIDQYMKHIKKKELGGDEDDGEDEEALYQSIIGGK